MNPHELQSAFNDAICCGFIYGVGIVFRIQAWLKREGLEKAQSYALQCIFLIGVGSMRILFWYSQYIGLAMITVAFTVEMFVNFVNLKVDQDKKLKPEFTHLDDDLNYDEA